MVSRMKSVQSGSAAVSSLLKMRQGIWIILVASALPLGTADRASAEDLTPAAPVAPDPLRKALFDDATFTLHERSYLFDQYNNEGNDPAAWAIGGWAGYQSGWIADFLQFGVVGYTTQPLWAPQDRAGSLLLSPEQEGFSVLGQAYAALRYNDQILTLYRQMIDQPEVNAHDNRMVPNTFEGVTLAGELNPVSYYAGFLTGTKTRDSDKFINFAEVVGIDQSEPMYLGGLTFSPNEQIKARTSLYVVPNLLASSYSEGQWALGQFDGNSINLSSQFMIQTGIGDELLTDSTSWVFGVMGDVTQGGLTLTAGYTANGSDEDWQSPYGMWPGYTNMVIGVFDRAGEQAVLLGAAYDLAHIGMEGLNVSVQAAIDTHVADGLPKWSEYDFTADYDFSAIHNVPRWMAPMSIRAQYALLQSDDTDGDGNLSGEVRLILNYELKSKGKNL